MCNTNSCGCNGNNRGGNGACGCCSLLNGIARAIDNLFANSCNNGCGCNCNNNNNRMRDLSGFTDCGNYDSYYARQYGLCNRGCGCNL